MNNKCIYYVEGQCEAVLLAALKEQPQRIVPGRVRVFNVIQKLIPRSQLVTIQTGSVVVFVFDTDVSLTDILNKNIQLVKKYCSRTQVVYLPQVLNLEDELVRCTNANRIVDLTHSKSTKNFKKDFCAMTNCRAVLERHNLDVARLWTTDPPKAFDFVTLNGDAIKLK